MAKIANNYEEAVQSVTEQMKEGSAYLDWGATAAQYMNVVSKDVADKVGRHFKEMGYMVYYNTMGYGSSRIAPGTPICMRIYADEEQVSRSTRETGIRL